MCAAPKSRFHAILAFKYFNRDIVEYSRAVDSRQINLAVSETYVHEKVISGVRKNLMDQVLLKMGSPTTNTLAYIIQFLGQFMTPSNPKQFGLEPDRDC